MIRNVFRSGAWWKLPFTLSIFFLFSAFALFAQEQGDDVAQEQGESAEPGIETAPVMVDGETYFVLRGSVSFSAEERAAKVVERIIEAAERNLRGDPKVEIRPSEFGPAIFSEGILVTHVVDADLQLEQVEEPLLAQKYADAIAEATRAYRGGRTEAAIEHGLLKALMLTGVYIVFVFTVLTLQKYGRRRTRVRIEAWSRDLEEQSGQAVSARPFLALWRLFTTGIVTIVVASATYYYVALVLGGFGRTKTLAAMLLDTVAAPLVGLGQAALGAIPNLLALIVIIIITRYLLQVLRLVFQNIQNGIIKLKGFDREWAWPTYRIVKVVVIIVAVVVAYPYVPGSGTDAFKGITILLGVLMSLGANSMASNMLGGLVVIYKRSINQGDLIKVGDITGYVEHVALLDTHLRSLKNELVSIPNSVLTGNQVINYTRTAGTTGLLLHTTVGIGYEEPQKKVERLLIEAAVETAGVKEKPGPFVLRTALGSHDVAYEINVYMLKDFKPVRVYSELHENILNRFNRAGVQIMTPFYTGDPAEPKIAPPGDDAAKSRRIPDREDT